MEQIDNLCEYRRITILDTYQEMKIFSSSYHLNQIEISHVLLIQFFQTLLYYFK